MTCALHVLPALCCVVPGAHVVAPVRYDSSSSTGVQTRVCTMGHHVDEEAHAGMGRARAWHRGLAIGPVTAAVSSLGSVLRDALHEPVSPTTRLARRELECR